MANYSIPAKYFFMKAMNVEVIDTPPITNKTIELGTRYSPSTICTPFKYTLGSFIESLDLGAELLIQQGGGCKYGYYSEVQEEILKDLGYKFKMLNLVNAGKMNIKHIYNTLKMIDSKLNIFKTIYYFINTRYIIKYMDLIDDYIRKNIGFEVNKGEFNSLNKSFLNNIIKKNNILSIKKCYKEYLSKFKKIKINKPINPIRVGIIGELYTIMEPFANYKLEELLASYKIEVTRFTNVEYLLFQKKKYMKKNLKLNKYVNYSMGADSSDNICRCLELCENNFDGIIHIKSTFCTPEISTIPILNKVCKDYDIPIIYLSYDVNTGFTGIETRIDAFYDMMEAKREGTLFRS